MDDYRRAIRAKRHRVMVLPGLLLLFGGLFVASQTGGEMASADTFPFFSMSVDSDKLPHSGPQAWCRQADIVRNIMKALNDTAAVKNAHESVVAFDGATTVAIDPRTKSFACHGVARLSNGQFLPGTFSVHADASGHTVWKWMNDNSRSFRLAPAAGVAPTVRVLKVVPAAADGGPPTMPNAERLLIAAVERARAAYAAGANDMARGAARPARAKEICATLKDFKVSKWLGEVETLSSNSDGLGVLSVQIGQGISIKTWNNAISDAAFQTLIKPDSAVYKLAVALKERQRVTFDGQFFPDPTDCIREGSLTLNGSVTQPEFIFRFSNIMPIQ